tara:strand:- start:8781 stop:9185 length:405 start_codon:yes stop_codon:yes gene_type:complete
MTQVILVITALLSQCPTPLAVSECEDCEVISLPEGCPSPYEGFLVTPHAFQRASAEFTGLEHLVLSCRDTLRDTRSELGSALEANASLAKRFSIEAEELAVSIESLPPPPSRVLWSSVGVAVGVLATILVMEAI